MKLAEALILPGTLGLAAHPRRDSCRAHAMRVDNVNHARDGRRASKNRQDCRLSTLFVVCRLRPGCRVTKGCHDSTGQRRMPMRTMKSLALFLSGPLLLFTACATTGTTTASAQERLQQLMQSRRQPSLLV